MPTYEYECKNCGYVFDEFHKINEEPEINCPECGAGEVERLISAGAGLIFKGSGFYITDYKKKGSDKKVTKTKDSTTVEKTKAS